MSKDSQQNQWPTPKFYFSVDFNSGSVLKEILFQEVSGLDTESQIIEYSTEDSPEFSTIKMPGLKKSSSIILKKGLVKDENAFWEWYGQIKMNTIIRTSVTIHLLGETGSPTITWELENAWPTKISMLDMKSTSRKVAIEAIEIAHEGISQS